MARTARMKLTGEGTAYYHLMSRTNDKRFLFEKGRVKTEMVATLRRAAAFSGIELKALVAMDNHFHVVCKVTRGAGPVPKEEILRRVAILKGEKAADALAERWHDLEKAGLYASLEAEMEKYRLRMNDISEMVKTFKEQFNVWFKRERGYCGSLWSGRFASTLIEGGRYLATCMRYVALNPVRARIVTQAKDYRWSWVAEPEPSPSPVGPVPTETGPVPEGALLKRVAQIGAGKVFGSSAFVAKWVFNLGSCLKSRSAGPVPVGEWAFASHGWRLAKA